MTGRQIQVELNALAWLDNKTNWHLWEIELRKSFFLRFIDWLCRPD
jgi:hypothetical protein